MSPSVMTAFSIPMELKAVRSALAVSSAVKTTGTDQVCTGTFALTANEVVFRRIRTVASAVRSPALARPRMAPSSA